MKFFKYLDYVNSIYRRKYNFLGLVIKYESLIQDSLLTFFLSQFKNNQNTLPIYCNYIIFTTK